MRTRVLSLILLGLAVSSVGSARGADQPQPAPVEPSAFFIRDVMPLVNRLGCNQVQCHGSDQGKGGLALSLFGAAPEEDYETLVKSDGARRVNRVEPAKSLLLLKPTATIAHGGGQKIQPGSPEYSLVLAWLNQGAPWGDERLPKLLAVKAAPQEQVLQKGQTQQLAVSAVFSDGTQTDVTRMASFRSVEATVATVDAEGKVKAEDFGQSAIVATYLRQFAVVRILVPQQLPDPFPTVQPNNRIDELVFARLKTLGIPPSEVCADEVFLRRVFLDAIGTLPTPEEVRAFLSDADPQKRSKLIDRLLERPEFVDFWTLKWSDLLRVKSEAPVNLWPKGAETHEPQHVVCCLAVSPDGTFLAGGSGDSAAYVWNLEEKKLVATLKEHQNWVLGICFSADGKLLATGSADKSWRVWEAGTWQPLFYKWMQDDAVRRCAFSPPRGDLVAVAVAGRSDRAVRIRYKEANSAQQIKVLDTGPGLPQDLLWLAQGNKLYVACSDKTVRVFDAGKWELAATLQGHGDWVYAVAATADGTKLASGSGDGTVKLWNTADHSLLATLVQLAPRTDAWLIVTGQGYFSTSIPGAVQWKTANVPATPEKLSGLRNPELVQQSLAGQKTPAPTLQ